MPNPQRQPADGDAAIAATIKAAVEDLLGDTIDVEAPDLHWLGLGLRLGLERPDRARRLLEMLETDEAHAATPAGADAAIDPDDIPVRSRLLAGSAVAAAEADPDIIFGWVSRLAPGEIMAIGRAVEQLLADGAPNDVTRGFGIAWRAGAKIPLKGLEGMMAEFAQLQLVVAGVLAGRDLAAAAGDESRGRGGLLGGLLGPRRGSSPALHEADLVLQQRGRSASLGLVALWNAWTAVRYRELIPAATFDLLVKPWVIVVGRLP